MLIKIKEKALAAGCAGAGEASEEVMAVGGDIQSNATAIKWVDI